MVRLHTYLFLFRSPPTLSLYDSFPFNLFRGGFGNCLPALQPPLLRGISAYSRIRYMIEIDHGHGDWYVSTEARVAGGKNELILGDFRYM